MCTKSDRCDGRNPRELCDSVSCVRLGKCGSSAGTWSKPRLPRSTAVWYPGISRRSRTARRSLTNTSSSASSDTSGSHRGTAPSGLPENLNDRSELARRFMHGGSTSRSKFLRTLILTSRARPARSFGSAVILLRSTSRVSRTAQHLVTVGISSILFPDANRCFMDFGRFGSVLSELSLTSRVCKDTQASSNGIGETIAFSATKSSSSAPHLAIHSGSALSSHLRSDSRFSRFKPQRSGRDPSPPSRFPSASSDVKKTHVANEPGRLPSLAPFTSTTVSRENL
mmetsp:Transcript_1401/g.6241  ORF Transcript_1401/g.6241 Transcript_1401/m.6241 type:complete len:283 (-) Transcript_1401:1043-1891(-)